MGWKGWGQHLKEMYDIRQNNFTHDDEAGAGAGAEYHNGQQLTLLKGSRDLWAARSYLIYWRRLELWTRINRGNNHGGVYDGIKEWRTATQRELNFLSDLNGAGWRSIWHFLGTDWWLFFLNILGGSDVYNWGTKIIILLRFYSAISSRYDMI